MVHKPINTDTHRETTNGERTTPYGFSCGYVKRVGDNDYPSATLDKQGCYNIRGFDRERVRFWVQFEYLTEARKYLAKFAKDNGLTIRTTILP